MGRSEGVIFEYLKWGHELKKRKERKKEKNFLENSRGLLDENFFFFFLNFSYFDRSMWTTTTTCCCPTTAVWPCWVSRRETASDDDISTMSCRRTNGRKSRRPTITLGQGARTLRDNLYTGTSKKNRISALSMISTSNHDVTKFNQY